MARCLTICHIYHLFAVWQIKFISSSKNHRFKINFQRTWESNKISFYVHICITSPLKLIICLGSSKNYDNEGRWTSFMIKYLLDLFLLHNHWPLIYGRYRHVAKPNNFKFPKFSSSVFLIILSRSLNWPLMELILFRKIFFRDLFKIRCHKFNYLIIHFTSIWKCKKKKVF